MRNLSKKNLDKIKELAKELTEHNCMAESITADVKSVIERWDLLQHKVNNCLMISLHIFFLVANNCYQIIRFFWVSNDSPL